MQTDLTSGAHHGRTRRLYVWGLPRGKRKRRNGLDLCGPQSPAASAQARPAVGCPLRGHEAPLAAGGQKHRWPAWLVLGSVGVCTLDRVDAGEESPLARYGSILGRECRGTGVHWPTERPQTPDSGSFQHRPGLCGLGQGRCRRDQCVDAACGQRFWLCRCQYPLVRYHGAGVAHWVSQRTRDLAGLGTALWPRPVEAQNAGGLGSRGRLRAGPDDPQVGQRTPPVCPEQTGKASGVDAPAYRGGPVDRAHPSHVDAAGTATRSRHTTCHGHTGSHARGGEAPHPADRAVDHHWGGGQGQNRACWFDAGAGDCAQQGREKGGVWPTVSPESPRWGVYLWDVDPWGGGRVEDAHTGACGVPRDLWCAGHTHVDGLRPGRICHRDPKGVGHRGGQGEWHVAEAVRETVRSERGKTEGIIGTLKTDKYGFNKPKERLWQTLEMAGPRSILSFNLNKLMRDLGQAAR